MGPAKTILRNVWGHHDNLCQGWEGPGDGTVQVCMKTDHAALYHLVWELCVTRRAWVWVRAVEAISV